MTEEKTAKMDSAPKAEKSNIFFWIFAIAVLFFGLGVNGLWASEDRWAEIAREMILSKDFLHPAINGQVYFDKPLLTYWLIAGIYYIFNCLNEFVIRMPSALAALVGLYGTISIGTRLWDHKTGVTAGWVLLSCYGFLFWGRTAAADMANLAAIIAAVAWFFYRERKAGFFSYLIFYLICFLGAMAKGLPALVMPVAAIAPYVLCEGRWKKHLTFANFAAAFVGLGIYIIPFYLAAEISMPDWYRSPPHQLTGLELVWRENIVRVFMPFDHNDEPFFCYLYQLPRVMIPWVMFFIAAVAGMIMNWKTLKPNTRWLALAALIIFLLFSASGSRRWYYILPLMPFCAIMVSLFLNSATRARWEWLVFEIMRWAVILIASLSFVSIILLPFWTRLAGFQPPLGILIGAPLFGLITLCIMFADERGWRKELSGISGMPGEFAGLVLAVATLTGGFFAVLWPSLDEFRTEKPFVQKMKVELAGISPENIIFYRRQPTKMVYYMDLRRPATEVNDLDELKKFLAAKTGKKAIVSYNKKLFLDELKTVLTAERVNQPDFQEKYAPLERKKARKLMVWIINNQKVKHENTK